ncbi:uncharacterized protein BT62DRAFT_929793 [Guyanagaster necrorhizus]|uniref:F-box domain-containing protein n=1 Tax=Guyanagaster necrorhizus TaxID=856835 RepID=A0A9P8AUN8_9AGAR|nr:uncharacterized protein BT62DRAFT_929793 [Guyanagaster necrorhizus MCA 3950]KAG7448699.1 hypothetical protein BT62DRAFT_929793 [Guyanagaster necrorhizus MCA 3950]
MTICEGLPYKSLSDHHSRYFSLLSELCLTNDNPSPSTKALIRSNILPELHADACQLDKEIDYLHGLLDAVQKNKDEITSMERTFRTLLSPVRIMPDEIVMEIFKNVARDSEVKRGVVKEAAWTLSHVCRSWRATALACRELWTTISVRIADYNIKKSDKLPVLLQTVLERSGNRLLDVSFVLELSHSDGISEEDALTDMQRGAITTLFNESHRWLRASLSIPSGAVEDLLDPHPALPALVSLCLQTKQRWATQAYDGPDISLWCPRLTSLSLLGVPPTSVTLCNSLSHMSVQLYDNQPTFSQDYALRYLTSLEPAVLQTLSFSSLYRREYCLSIGEPITFPLVDTLRTFNPTILNNVVLPALHDIHLGPPEYGRATPGHRYSTPLLPALDDMLRRSHCFHGITRLVLEYVIPDQVLVDMLVSLPNLARLVLFFADSWSAKMEAGVAMLVGILDIGFVGRLEELEMRNMFEVSYLDEPLVHMAEWRWRSWSGAVRLRRLRLGAAGYRNAGTLGEVYRRLRILRDEGMDVVISTMGTSGSEEFLVGSGQ